MLEQNQGELLLLSPRRDELAWARMTVLAIVNTHAAETQLKATSNNANKPVSHDQIYHSGITNMEQTKKHAENDFKLLKPSSPYPK